LHGLWRNGVCASYAFVWKLKTEVAMKNLNLKLGLLAALCVASQAQAGDLYLGAALGPSKVAVVDCSAISCDTSSTGFKLLGGYRVTPHLSVEAMYLDFGSATAGSGVLHADLKTTAFGAGVAYKLDLNRQWSAVGRLGLASVESKATGTLSLWGLGGSTSKSGSTTSPYLGLAVGYAVNREMTVQAGWDSTEGEIFDRSGRVDLFSVGLTYDF
jgi:OOP family OmpA-OmpF porin